MSQKGLFKSELIKSSFSTYIPTSQPHKAQESASPDTILSEEGRRKGEEKTVNILHVLLPMNSLLCKLFN